MRARVAAAEPPRGVLRRSCGGKCGDREHACGDCRKEKLQRSATAPAAPLVPAAVHDVLRTPGVPLDPRARAELEPFFGSTPVLASPVAVAGSGLRVGENGAPEEREADDMARRSSSAAADARGPRFDFGAIRIHADARAAESARAVHARAYTVGTHIVFDNGAYAPHTADGRRLLAHELTHAVQQASGARAFSPLRRSLKVDGDKPGDVTTVKGWVDQLCPKSGWKFESRELTNKDRKAACPPRTDDQDGQNPGSVSCGCLCDVTHPEFPEIRVRVRSRFEDLTKRSPGDTFWNKEDGSFDVSVGKKERPSGEGVQPKIKSKSVRAIPWLVFAHEVCGHVRKKKQGSEGSMPHATTREGNQTTMDVENAIRREHSRGQRFGAFGKRESGRKERPGAYYTTGDKEKLGEILEKTGIDPAWPNHVFRHKPAQSLDEGVSREKVPRDPATVFAAGERLLIQNIDWYVVVGNKGTAKSIAELWDVDAGRLKTANPEIAWGDEKFKVPAGTTLLIPHPEKCSGRHRKPEREGDTSSPAVPK